MIIRKMTANFGTLDHAELELQPGLNVIEAPNESGKSTWCAFLRTMLYGLDTSQREKKGVKPDKVLYAPWNGTAMSGAVELTWQGRDITVSRSTGPAGPMREFSAVYTGTSRTVEQLTESDAGELLLGMPLSVFRRTAFISGADMAVRQDAELEKKIDAILSSGEEGSSYSQAAERLGQWSRALRYRKQGKLPALEAREAALRDRADAIDNASAGLDRLDTMEEKGRILLSAMQQDLRETDADRDELTDRLSDLERQQTDREREAEILRRELDRGILRGREPEQPMLDELREELRRGARAAKRLEADKPGFWGWALCLLAAAACLLLGFRVRYAFYAFGAFLLGAAALLIRFVSDSRERSKAEKVLWELKEKYGSSDPKELADRVRDSIRQWREWKALSSAAEELRSQRWETADRGKPSPETEERRRALQEKIAAAERQIRETREARARLQGQIDTLGDTLVIRSELSRLEEERLRLEEKYAALTAASEELALADEEMQQRFAPRLSREATEMLRRLTGEKRAEIALDRDMTAAVREGGELTAHDSAYLSRGARDQAYLAVRLALCELLPAEEPCPLVLDDALLTFDDERMARAMEVLSEMSRTRQIILFTCHSRERRALGR